MAQVELRDAHAEDAEAIARIYTHYILNSTATFHTEPVDEAERRAWMAERHPDYPTLVAVDGSEVCAWGALSRYSPRPGWNPTAEVAIYVAPDHTAQGIGPLLLGALIMRARELGLRTLVSQVAGGNEPSIAMAERAGFRKVGTLREVGLKLGERLDVVIMQLMLNEC